MKKFLIALLTITFMLVSWTVRALDEFVITDVRVVGLQKISAGTVFNYLPLKVGDQVTKESARESIRALFETGFFRDVQLEQDGTVLIVVVQERSSIAAINYIGNKQIDDKDLGKALLRFEVAEGRIFDQSALDRVTQEIKAVYFSKGRYSAKVTTTVTPLDNNRVSITINIDEGDIAKIKQIKILGNKIFTTKELLKEFDLSESNAIRFYSKKDRYSKQKLTADLESLRSFYQDQGFLEFKLESSQVSISPDKKEMFITIKIFEGERYVISGFSVTGQDVVPNEELVALVSVKTGEVFSRKDLTSSRRVLISHLADDGYAFASVNTVPKVDKIKRTVEYNFVVDPGKRVYVRRIEIRGNTTTQDEVIRREFRQFEGGWYSTSKVRRSRVRLNRLGFFEDIKIETPAVPGSDDQVDIIVKVVEKPTGSFTLGVGYSDDEGIIFQAGVNERNVLGSGKEISFNFDNSAVTDVLDLSYNNPFHKPNGTSRGFSLVRRTVDSTESVTADYISETLALGVNYRFPISEFNSLRAGLDVEEVNLETTATTPPEIGTFIIAHPDNINYRLVTAIAHDTRDSLYFPSSGVLRRFSLEVSLPGSDLEYYKASVRGSYFRSISQYFTFKAMGDIGYGDGYGNLDELPFYKNYYAGGAGSVRGFNTRSLGPRDSSGDPLGGSSRVLGNTEIIIGTTEQQQGPRNKRIAIFVDTGMVYGSDEDIDLAELRVSSGVAFYWITPLGPLSLSYGIPINDKAGDDIEKFQFTLGRIFR